MFTEIEGTPLPATPPAKRNPRSIDAIDAGIGKRIEERRMLAGHSRKELAAQVGITHQQLHKYERGINRISASRLLHIAELLNTPVAEFYEQKPTSASELNYEEALRALKEFITLGHPHQKHVIKLMIDLLTETKYL